MRVGIVRSDIQHVYLADVENTSQRVFSSSPAGQSRYFVKPSDTAVAAMLATYALLSVRGSDTSATVDTSTDKTLRIRTVATNPFTVINVTSGATTAKTTIRDDLNAAFTNASLPLLASVVGTNQIQINTTIGGPTAYLQIDTTASGSNLNTSVGFSAGGTTLSGLTVAGLQTAVYPTAVTINVASATILALSTFSLLTSTQQTNLVTAVADLIAPKLIETGPVLLSFVYGIISKLRSAAFQPGGARIGLPAGVAAAVVQDDGSTVFSI